MNNCDNKCMMFGCNGNVIKTNGKVDLNWGGSLGIFVDSEYYECQDCGEKFFDIDEVERLQELSKKEQLRQESLL